MPKLRKIIRSVLTESSRPQEGAEVEVFSSRKARESGVPDYVGIITNVITKNEDFHRSYMVTVEEQRDGEVYYQTVPAYQVRKIGAKYFMG